MQPSKELCKDTLYYLKAELGLKYPRVLGLVDSLLAELPSIPEPECYPRFKILLQRIRDNIGDLELKRILTKPKSEYKKDMASYIYGTSHSDKCRDPSCTARECVIKRGIYAHMNKKESTQMKCGALCHSCRLLRDLRDFQIKKNILKARYCIGDQGLIDLVCHAVSCQTKNCGRGMGVYSCPMVKRYLDHERQCVDSDCSCCYIDPVFRFVGRSKDDIPKDENLIEKISDVIHMSGFDEEELRREALAFVEIKDEPVERKPQYTQVRGAAGLYVWSFGLEGSLD